MQHNPINLIRNQIQTQVEGEPKSKGPTPEEVAKENERLRALHEGWVKHPITMKIIHHLELEFYNAQQMSFNDSKNNKPSNKTLEAAILDDTLRYIRTLTH